MPCWGTEGCSVPGFIFLYCWTSIFHPQELPQTLSLSLAPIPTPNLASCFMGLHFLPPGSCMSCNLLISPPSWKAASPSSTPHPLTMLP